ncbi:MULTISPECIES: beta-1,6-N-acetylglucosaminyltransferase [Thermomonospora]|uniref:Peptide O-xylosyltransferase n=1 Tax=Thermomonospora curvata (strain ATCC 19995 / DSM 43183 / JCM 3096 / KCTC 9072 / NBRC 15933 / NCIMB 10081 / Henssen B9) TaxID=471852 RepID=D1A7L5_THECD|nr:MULTISPECIES: beta-1,6-N-acetylglucosaminyltransferase [Thermomonospora]ACY96604.1 glycosyl transferase family 14 [Thermomonospora curvata DSM 43183]PKK15410.1 MAG: hypothetical protein BUE48_004940 [Thermomonospora sp. CIF 1]
MSKGPIAVIVLSHRDSEQVTRLIHRITEGTNSFAVIHHDPSGEPLSIPPSSQVAVIPDPIPCKWGRLSLVQAQWKTLQWVARNVPEFSWALLVSGQDYPIRKMSAIEQELAGSPYDAYLRYFRVGPDPAEDVIPWQALTRRRYLYKRRVPFSRRSVTLPFKRRHPYRNGVELYVGDMWFNLSAPTVAAVLDARQMSERMLSYLRFAPIPDETFIASMTLNVHPAPNVAHDSKRYIKWGRRQLHPQIITAEHLPDLRASDAFFARKIDRLAHPEIPDLLDRLAEERTASSG